MIEILFKAFDDILLFKEFYLRIQCGFAKTVFSLADYIRRSTAIAMSCKSATIINITL